jgi:hypothetical protein
MLFLILTLLININYLSASDNKVSIKEGISDIGFKIPRDPFYRQLDQFIDENKKVKPTDVNLNDVVLVGTVYGVGSKSMAMFKALDKYKYILKVGDKIGLRGGKIVKILKGKVEIKEEDSDALNGTTDRVIIKRIGRN